MKRILLAVSVLLLGVSTVAHAQGGVDGPYVIVPLTADTLRLEDGRTEVNVTNMVIFVLDDTSSPFRGAKGKCTARWVLSESGVTIAERACCIYTTPDGDGFMHQADMEETETERCPYSCGRWVLHNGYGKFQDMVSEGTWQFVTPFADGKGGLGVLTGTYTKP
jgi:hypothetical protein